MVLSDEPGKPSREITPLPQVRKCFVEWPHRMVIYFRTDIGIGPIDGVVNEEIEIDVEDSLHE
jgi:hypothetical protein